MALFDRFRDSRNQINGGSIGTVFGEYGWPMVMKPYSRFFVTIITNQILQSLKNLEIYSTNETKEYRKRITNIIDFVSTNTTRILYKVWTLGFVAIGRDRYGKLYLPDTDDIRIDPETGRVTNFSIVYYSDEYITRKSCAFAIIKPVLEEIDTLCSANDYGVRHLGKIAFVSGKSIPMSNGDKTDMQEEFQNALENKRDSFRVFPFNSEISVQEVDLGLDKLNFDERLKSKLRYLCSYFRVPFELIGFNESTFDNQKQRVKDFYANCINPIGEMLLQIVRYIIREEKNLLVPSKDITFRIINVPDLESDLNPIIDFNIKLLDLVQKMRDMGMDDEADEYTRKLQKINE